MTLGIVTSEAPGRLPGARAPPGVRLLRRPQIGFASRPVTRVFKNTVAALLDLAGSILDSGDESQVADELMGYEASEPLASLPPVELMSMSSSTCAPNGSRLGER